jgi:hypothetical protein
MSKSVSRAALAGAVFVSVASFATTTAKAFEFSGARVGAEYSRFSSKQDDGAGTSVTVDRATIDSGLEFAITPRISAQIDIVHHETTFDSAQSYGLHAIYHLEDGAAFGGFLQREESGGSHVNGFGVEYARTMGAVDFELFASKFNGDAEDEATVFGGNGRYAMGGNFGLILDAARVDFGEDTKLTRIALGTDYQVNDSTTLYLTGGSARLSRDLGSTSEGFVAIGAKINLGRGTTFGNRSLLGLFPGL